MRFEDLSAEQQALLNTNFGSETEKVAAEQAKIASEMYSKGLEIASNIADAMDKQAAEAEKTASEAAELEDAGAEKMAAQMGAFIERGQFDGLRKLGSDRHGNEWHYILPFVEEKVASAAAKAGLQKFRQFMATGAQKAKGMAQSGAKKVKDYHQGMGANARQAVTGKPSAAGGEAIKGKGESILRGLSGKERAMEAGKAVAKASPYAAAAAAGGAAASKKKND